MATQHRHGRWAFVVWTMFGLYVMPGCVKRRYTIRTDPPGALVLVNKEEIGPSPVSHSFTYYGDREITVMHDDYQTLSVIQPIDAPWWTTSSPSSSRRTSSPSRSATSASSITASSPREPAPAPTSSAGAMSSAPECNPRPLRGGAASSGTSDSDPGGGLLDSTVSGRAGDPRSRRGGPVRRGMAFFLLSPDARPGRS